MKLIVFSVCSVSIAALSTIQVTGQVVLDFEEYTDPSNPLQTVEFQRGDVLTDQYASQGVYFSAEKYKNRNSKLKEAELWIFDTDEATTGGGGRNDGDPDLVSPGYGPGNDGTDFDNVIVIQEDTDNGSIPDDRVKGGVITVSFASEVNLLSLGVLDIERAGKTFITGYDANDNVVFSHNRFDNIGDNSFNRVLFQEQPISYFTFDHKGSFAITDIQFDTNITPIPEPATVAGLSVSGLLVLLCVRRRVLSRIRKA